METNMATPTVDDIITLGDISDRASIVLGTLRLKNYQDVSWNFMTGNRYGKYYISFESPWEATQKFRITAFGTTISELMVNILAEVDKLPPVWSQEQIAATLGIETNETLAA